MNRFFTALAFIFFIAITPVVAVDNSSVIGTVETTSENKTLSVRTNPTGTISFSMGPDFHFVMDSESSPKLIKILDIYLEVMNSIETNGYTVSYSRQSGIVALAGGDRLRLKFSHSEESGSLAKLTVIYQGLFGNESFYFFLDKEGINNLKNILSEGFNYISEVKSEISAINQIIDEARDIYQKHGSLAQLAEAAVSNAVCSGFESQRS